MYVSFEEAYEEFKIYARNRHKKQGFYNLTHDFTNKVLPYFKGKNIYDITKTDILRWQNAILELNYSNSYNSRLYYVFNSFMKYCCSYYDLKENVCSLVGSFPKRNEKKNFDFYTLEEFNKFIKCVDDVVYKQYFSTLFYCGLRPSEAMALQFSDLNGDIITISKNLRRHGDREFDTPKNNSSYRDIKVPKVLLKNLNALKKVYSVKYGSFKNEYFIFGGIKPLAPTTIDRYKLKACQKANLRPITQHQFRHSNATLLASCGVPLNYVQKHLGHSNLSTTTDCYLHVEKEYEKRVQSTLNSFENKFYNLTHDFTNLFSLFKR